MNIQLKITRQGLTGCTTNCTNALYFFATKAQRHEEAQKTACILSEPLCLSVFVAMVVHFVVHPFDGYLYFSSAALQSSR